MRSPLLLGINGPDAPCLSMRLSSHKLIRSVTRAQWNPLPAEFIGAIYGGSEGSAEPAGAFAITGPLLSRVGRARCRGELSQGPHETRERTDSLPCPLARCHPKCLVPGRVNPVSRGHVLCVFPPHQWPAPPGWLSFGDDNHCVASLGQPRSCLAGRLLDLANKSALSGASGEGGCEQNAERSRNLSEQPKPVEVTVWPPGRLPDPARS